MTPQGSSHEVQHGCDQTKNNMLPTVRSHLACFQVNFTFGKTITLCCTSPSASHHWPDALSKRCTTVTDIMHAVQSAQAARLFLDLSGYNARNLVVVEWKRQIGFDSNCPVAGQSQLLLHQCVVEGVVCLLLCPLIPSAAGRLWVYLEVYGIFPAPLQVDMSSKNLVADHQWHQPCSNIRN